MSLSRINPAQTKAWTALQDHFNQDNTSDIKSLFESESNRAKDFSIQWNNFYVDYSKNALSKKTMDLLIDLSKEVGLSEAIAHYFNGTAINETESRAVLHTALRDKDATPINVDGENIIPQIREVKAQMKAFSNDIINGTKRGYTGKAFTDVVNIGIGGSDLGPAMVVEALKFYKNHLKVHFVSNVDGDHVQEVIRELNPETTLFVVVSKTFTTQETLSNATTIKNWFLETASQEDVAKHFAAVSTNTQKISDFGIVPAHVFTMWDWVGGRFSLWSAVGLSIALAVGYDHFEAMLDGAFEMDQHFKHSPFEENIPVVLSLISIWYANFHQAETQAVIPYTQYLSRFSAYLQQGIMESNGKCFDRSGNRVSYETETVIWGEPGTNSQHAFFQLMHQGTKLIPADFIGFKKSLHGDTDHHNKLMANFFAQTEALLSGKTRTQVDQEFAEKGTDPALAAKVAPFKVFEGNKPTNTLLIDQLTPETLGSLIALYEHKIFVQGVIWNIFSYDQWGVELGKQLATNILSDIEGSTKGQHDPSTQLLLEIFNS
ncbi:glucose-6-phosphate isomerase [Flavobacteriaceae bacterium]|nr:glucose-6-phosphate isomerase [Flavobacteriaceae bacterium]MDB9726241.1 glucose-6-phosphate isomerase [Flavobacteriaceae bacterium]MDB9902837.1 glucose-6-phosphate isomerase [Flavobacteriaceae bacterium]